jgi:hypothetical protein
MKPRSVAVIGASADPSKTAGRPVVTSLKHGFRRRDLSGESEGRRDRRPEVLPRRASLPEPRPMSASCCSAPSARTGGARTCRAWHGGGHRAGQRLHRNRRRRRAAAAASGSRGRMRILGPNTIGLVNLTDRISCCPPRARWRWTTSRRAASAWCRRAAASSDRCCRARRRAASDCRSWSPPATRRTWTGRLHRLSGGRRCHLGDRAVHGGRAQPGEVQGRGAEGRAQGQAGRRVQGRALGIGRGKPRCRTPARWPVRTACTTRCSARSA